MSEPKNLDRIISVEKKDHCQVITLYGEISYDSVNLYKEKLYEAMEKESNYLLDLSNVTRIDSTGIGLIVSIAKKKLKDKNTIKLVINNPLIYELFIISRLDKVFKIFNNHQEASASFDDDDYFDKVKEY